MKECRIFNGYGDLHLVPVVGIKGMNFTGGPRGCVEFEIPAISASGAQDETPPSHKARPVAVMLVSDGIQLVADLRDGGAPQKPDRPFPELPFDVLGGRRLPTHRLQARVQVPLLLIFQGFETQRRPRSQPRLIIQRRCPRR